MNRKFVLKDPSELAVWGKEYAFVTIVSAEMYYVEFKVGATDRIKVWSRDLFYCHYVPCISSNELWNSLNE